MYKINRIPKLARYGFVGVLAFTAEYSSFFIIFALVSTENLFVAQTVSFCVGLFTSFLGSRLFTFKDPTKLYYHDKKTQFTNYIILAVINLLLTNLTIYALIEQLSIMFWLAKIIVMISVVVWNYTILNRLIFKVS